MREAKRNANPSGRSIRTFAALLILVGAWLGAASAQAGALFGGSEELRDHVLVAPSTPTTDASRERGQGDT